MSFLYGVSQIKGGRETQEDLCTLRSMEGTVALSDEGVREGSSTGSILAVLCDGMGGHTAGELAAQIVGAVFHEAFAELNAGDNPQAVLTKACEQANHAIETEILSSPELDGMGTTVVCVFSDGHRLWWLSVGDSHLLLLRAGTLTKLNRDHSMRAVLEHMAATGTITEEEAQEHPARNALLSVLNGNTITAIDLGDPLELLKEDVLIMASDGIDTIDRQTLMSILARSDQSLIEIADQITTAVSGAGGVTQDNTTALIIKVA